MKILFTGGSSFTGYWFIKELAAAGHEIVAPFRRQASEYPDAIRRARVRELMSLCRPIFNCSVGDDQFMDLLASQKWDLFCAHAADVTNYNSLQFDVAAALHNNTLRLPEVLDQLLDSACGKIIVTGSVFEPGEGAGDGDRAFSPYGLSKAFTWQTFLFHAELRSITIGKFVIPNPFGPYEERRFTHYLMTNWLSGAIPSVNTPLYVRDNIHVSLLARAYSSFANNLTKNARTNPSGYVESQGAFTLRVAHEIRQRLGLACNFKLQQQTQFAEPLVRINTGRLDVVWDEARSWDAFADYYATVLRR